MNKEEQNMHEPRLLSSDGLPHEFADVDDLEDFMSLPTPELIADLAATPGDITVLGVGGKMGVTLARLIKRADPARRVIGVSRFSEPSVEEKLNSWGVETISADLLDSAAVRRLPVTPNVIYMAGLKFDTEGREDFLWAMNVLAPANVAQHYAGSRTVVLSSIHVYPWSDPRRGGVDERELPRARPGEYANSVVGRERVFEYFSRQLGTPCVIVRFVYAVDMRYGVLAEIAQWVRDGKTIPLETGVVNVMWQGDAINQFVRLLRSASTPAKVVNVGGPELVSVRRLANSFGALLGKEPTFTGSEQDCLAVNCERANQLLGNPVVPIGPMIRWVADWVGEGKPSIGKPSKFEVRSGQF